MRFPTVCDICTQEVLSIDSESTLKMALDRMMAGNHRNIIILGGHYHHVLRAQEMLFFNLKKVPLETCLSELELPRLPVINKGANILDCVVFLKEEVDQVGVADDEGKLCGVLTHTDIVNSIDPEVLLENYTVSDVINKHRKDLWVKSSDPTHVVIQSMAKHGVDCAIAREGHDLRGVFTTKDVMRLYESGQDLVAPLSEYMSHPVQTVPASSSIKEALDFIQEKHFKRVVVVDDQQRLLGTVLQSQLISLSYSNWAVIMRNFQTELQEINALLEKKSRHYEGLAAQDALTGLYNRYKFTEVFVSELNTMQKRQNAMSLIMLDLDHFKKINDQYGHNAGDQVLVALAKVLDENHRQTDVICRWGGEEFLVLLPSATVEQAELIAEKLRNKIRMIDVLPDHQITASFGVTQVKDKDDLESLVGRVDEALYAAKKNGRDRIETRLD